MKMKEESEKVGLKLNIQKTKIMASSPITSLQIDGDAPDAKSWLIWKDPDFGKDWRQEKKDTTEDEIVRWHHWLNGHEWVDSRSWWWIGGLAWCSSWSRKESDTTEQLNWTEVNYHLLSSYIIYWLCLLFCLPSSECELHESRNLGVSFHYYIPNIWNTA